MNRFLIVIPPVLMFLVFFFFHSQFMGEHEKKLADAAAAKVAAEKAEIARKATLEAQAAEETRLRVAEAKRLEDERIAKENADRDERVRLLNESTEKYVTTGRGFQAEIARLQKELETARLTRDKTSGEALDLSLDVERARIAKRTADNEIQRLTELIQLRLAGSQLALMPPSAAPVPPK